MAAPGGLEQWQKDGFFPAAEEVQESADLMESIYRTWMRERSNGSSSEEVDDLQRELQTALGTAKWQLEQFERAVSSSNDKYSLEEGTVARRRQFVVAIEDQISRVEKEINGSSVDNGRRGLNWVKLDDEERDDLVAFLSAPAEFYSEMKSIDSSYRIPSRQKNVPIGMNDQKDAALIIKDIHEVPPRQISSVKSDVCGLADQLHGHRTNLSSGDGHWKIDIGNEMDDDRKLSPKGSQASSQTTALSGIRRSTESLTRVRWFWNSLWKPKSDEHRPLRYDMPNNLDFRVLSLLTQIEWANRKKPKLFDKLEGKFQKFCKDGWASYARPTTNRSVWPFYSDNPLIGVEYLSDSTISRLLCIARLKLFHRRCNRRDN